MDGRCHEHDVGQKVRRNGIFAQSNVLQRSGTGRIAVRGCITTTKNGPQQCHNTGDAAIDKHGTTDRSDQQYWQLFDLIRLDSLGKMDQFGDWFGTNLVVAAVQKIGLVFGKAHSHAIP